MPGRVPRRAQSRMSSSSPQVALREGLPTDARREVPPSWCGASPKSAIALGSSGSAQPSRGSAERISRSAKTDRGLFPLIPCLRPRNFACGNEGKGAAPSFFGPSLCFPARSLWFSVFGKGQVLKKERERPENEWERLGKRGERLKNGWAGAGNERAEANFGSAISAEGCAETEKRRGPPSKRCRRLSRDPDGTSTLCNSSHCSFGRFQRRRRGSLHTRCSNSHTPQYRTVRTPGWRTRSSA